MYFNDIVFLFIDGAWRRQRCASQNWELVGLEKAKGSKQKLGIMVLKK